MSDQMLEKNLRYVEKGKENIFEVIQNVEGDGKRLVFENRTVKPRRSESPARGHIFHEIDGFAGYLAFNGGGETIALVDIKAMRIKAVLDESEKNGIEVIGMVPQLHPLFEPWNELLDMGVMRMSDFVNFLATNHRAVVSPDGVGLKLILSQLKASTQTDLYRGEGSRSINGIMITTKIDADDGKGQLLELPDSITIETPLFITGDPAKIVIDMVLSIKDGEIIIKLASADMEVKKVEEFGKMVGKLEEVSSDFTVAYGEIAHCPRDYIR